MTVRLVLDVFRGFLTGIGQIPGQYTKQACMWPWIKPMVESGLSLVGDRGKWSVQAAGVGSQRHACAEVV
jgi:hypothetical protein